MPKGNQHLTYELRCQIYALLKRGCSQALIARDIGVHRSTICKEIKRNGGMKGYHYKQAHAKASARRSKANSGRTKLTLELIMFIERMLKERLWSPEQISGYMKKKYGVSVSHELIYQYIWKDKRNGGTLYKYLRRQGKQYKKRGYKNSGRGHISNRVGIEERPAVVDKKERIGDLEIDTVRGANHSGAILTMVDIMSKYTFLKLLSRATAKITGNAIIGKLESHQDQIHTLTPDNGKEFADHQRVTRQIGAKVYFARPYKSCDRPLNENTNGLLRQFFPKGTDFSKLTDEEVRHVEYLLNTRPRKALGYATPLEVFSEAAGKDLYSILFGEK